MAGDADPQTFLEKVEPAARRADGLALFELFNRVTGLAPRMWGPSMVGYGRYEYTYQSGRSGAYFMTGFSPRKANLSLYIMPGYDDLAEPLSRLGKYGTGKSCLYITRLDDVDEAVLGEIITGGMERLRTLHPCFDA